MKKKIICSVIIFIIILLSIVFVNSYAQALSRGERATDCYNNNYNCEQNGKCQRYQQNKNCITRNNHCQQRNCNWY